jgi:TPP-dependent 2-oxoacid decarboxylase
MMKKKEDELIYDLIFSEKENFKIDISEYISDIYKYEEFIDKIKKILKKSKVKIIISDTLMSSKTVIWELKVKK